MTRVRTGPAPLEEVAPVRSSVEQARIVLAHDYLTERGRAERFTPNVLTVPPHARLLTSFCAPELTFPGALYDEQTLPINPFARLRREPPHGLPLLPLVFTAAQVRDADIVFCSSSRRSRLSRSEAPKLVYCHNPPRWLYQAEDYFAESAAARVAIATAKPYFHYFRGPSCSWSRGPWLQGNPGRHTLCGGEPRAHCHRRIPGRSRGFPGGSLTSPCLRCGAALAVPQGRSRTRHRQGGLWAHPPEGQPVRRPNTAGGWLSGDRVEGVTGFFFDELCRLPCQARSTRATSTAALWSATPRALAWIRSKRC